MYFGHGGAPRFGKKKFAGIWAADSGIAGWLDISGDGRAGYVAAGHFYDGQLGLLALKSCFATRDGREAKVSPYAEVWLGSGFEAAGVDFGLLETVRRAK